jgi:Uma2 family endonuclease
MEAPFKRLVTIEEFQTFINLSENSEKIFELITGEIMDIYTRALHDWSGGNGSFQLDATHFKVMSAYYMDVEEYRLDLNSDGMKMLLRGALEHNYEVDYWWEKLDVPNRRRVCLHTLRTGNTPTRIRALYRLETLPDSDPPQFPGFVAQLLRTEIDEEILVAALQVLDVRARRERSREKYRIRAQYRERLLLRITHQDSEANTTESWKEVVFTPEIDLLISSIALNQAMPRVSEAAARVIGRIQSITAVRPLVREQKRGKGGALRALTLVRDESPNLPSFMSDQDRRYVWIANTARRLFDNPWGLFFRFAAALIGGWVGMGYLIFMIYRMEGFFAAQKWANALALGLMFGLFVALLVIFSGEFSARLRGFWASWILLIVSGVLGLVLGTVLWVQYQWLFLSNTISDLYWPAILLGGIGAAAGIVITAYFDLPGLPAIIITGVATYLPILYTWNNFESRLNPNIRSLLYFDDPSEVYSVAIPMVVVIAIGSHLPRLWRDMSRVIFPRISRRQIALRQANSAAKSTGEMSTKDSTSDAELDAMQAQIETQETSVLTETDSQQWGRYGVSKNTVASEIAASILTHIGTYLRSNDIGHVTGADGNYNVSGEIYAPHVAYISHVRLPEIPHQGFNPNPPELAVEVIFDSSDSQEQSTLRRKLANYLSAGVMVWVVDTEQRTIEVYQTGQNVQVLNQTGTLDGGDVLPGFKLAVKDIFAPQKHD